MGKIIMAVKRNGESFLITEVQASTIEQARKFNDGYIKILDNDTNKILFWGDPKEIKEFKQDSTFAKSQIIKKDSEDRKLIEQNFKANRILKNEWMKNKLLEPGMLEELEECKRIAKEKFELGIKGTWSGRWFLDEYSNAYFRKTNNCKYS